MVRWDVSNHLSVWKEFHCLSPSGSRDLSSVWEHLIISMTFRLLTLLLSMMTVVFCILCVPLLWPCWSEFTSHLLRESPSLSAESGKCVCQNPGWHTPSAGLASHVSSGSWCLALCPCQFGGSLSSFFLSSPGLWLRDQLNYFLLLPVAWSILVKQYFWQNTFHWVLNDLSTMSVIWAAHLGLNAHLSGYVSLGKMSVCPCLWVHCF